MKKKVDSPVAGKELNMQVPPRERLLAAARDLFGTHGIRAVSVDAIAEAAGSNKMTLYRHFASKDELVAEYLRRLADEVDTFWDELAAAHPDDARAQLQAWLDGTCEHLASSRGCPLTNAAVELPEKDHPARRVIEEHKEQMRKNLARLCQASGCEHPQMLADELFLLIEGARVSVQSVGPDAVCGVKRMAESLIESKLRS